MIKIRGQGVSSRRATTHVRATGHVGGAHLPAVAVGSTAAQWDVPSALYDAVLREEGPYRIALVVPVLGRPHRVRPFVQSLRAATSEADVTLYFVAQRSDVAEVDAIRRVGLEPLLVGDEDRSWAKKVNRGYERTTEPWVLLGADDLAFHRGWVDTIRPLLRTHAGVIGTNDLGNAATVSGSHSTHALVRRLYADILGTVDERRKVVHEGYDHNYPDTELVHTAKKRGLYLHRSDCVIEHLHPLWGKGKHDLVYERGGKHMKQDQALFTARARRFGW